MDWTILLDQEIYSKYETTIPRKGLVFLKYPEIST